MIFKIFLLNLVFILILVIQLKTRKKINSLSVSLFLLKNKIFIGFFVSFLFIFLFIVLFRLCKIIFFKSKVLNLKKIISLFFDYISINNLIIIMLMFVVFFSFKNYIIAWFKVNFLNCYFYFARSISLYFQYITNIDIILLRLFPGWFYNFGVFLLKYAFKIILLSFFIYDMLFNNFCIDLFLLPYYGIYYIVYNIIYFFKRFKIDFDQGFCMQLRNITVSTSSGFIKLYEYQKYLITNSSKIVFLNDFEKDLDLDHNNNKVYYYTFINDFNFLKQKVK